MQSPDLSPKTPESGPSETLCLPGGALVVASASRFWLHDAQWLAQAGQHTLADHGSADVMKQLLAACLLAGCRSHGAVSRPAGQRARTLPSYLWHLAGMYRTTHATPPAMLLAAQRFDSRGDGVLAARCRQVAAEELGHDHLALADLRALGLDAPRFVDAVRPPTPMALANLLGRMAGHEWPVAVFGYAFALERFSLMVDGGQLAATEACLPAGVHASRCLRVHSAQGTDARHVPESLEFMATLEPADRAAIAIAAFETSRVLCQPTSWPGDDFVLRAARECADGGANWLEPTLTDFSTHRKETA